MDLGKYPYEKLVFFVGGLIPGSVALLLYDLTNPHALGWFVGLGFLGYRSKLAMALAVAFVIGNTSTTFVWGFIGAVLGGYAGWTGAASTTYIPPHTVPVAPWRDQRWRTALAARLGPKAPKNSFLIAEPVLAMRQQMIAKLPPADQTVAQLNLDQEKLQAEIDDSEWAQWYDHYHQFVTSDARDKDVAFYIRDGLQANLEAASAYALFSLIWVPCARHWWVILPSCLWLLMLASRVFSEIRSYADKWSTLSTQIRYLTESGPTIPG